MAVSLLEKREENQQVSFKLGNEEYGIDILKVQEIIKVPEITRVPRTPDYVEGVVNLRGSILPIIDTRKRFGMESIVRDNTNRIIVMNLNGTTVGIIVDSVSEVLRMEEDKVEPPPGIIANTNADYLRGIGKLDGGKRLISLLDLEKIIKGETETENISGLSSMATGRRETEKARQKLDNESQLVSFQLGSEEYAVDIDLVEEIIRIPEITVIPDVPDYIRGVINLRGKVLPVISLRKRFHMGEDEYDNRSRILIVQTAVTRCREEMNCDSENCPAFKSMEHACWTVPETFCGGDSACSNDEKLEKCRKCSMRKKTVTFGVIVDVVNEVLSIPVRSIEPPSKIIAGETNNHLKGIGKLDNGKRLILLLNTGEVFDKMENKTLTDLSRDNTDSQDENLKGENIMSNDKQMVIFCIGDEEFAIDIMNVQEIIKMTDITEIPGTADFVEGVVNLRGGVLPVIDLRKRFSLEDREKTDSNRIVVANYNGTATGIIVDSVSEVLQLSEADVEPPPPVVSGIEASYIEGIGKMNNGERFIIILELGRILNLEEDLSRLISEENERIMV